MKHMDVGNGVGGSRILDDHVVDGLVLALVETDAEVRFRQGAEIITDFGVLACHIDEYRAEWQLLEELVLVRFQDAHETEVLGRDLGVEVALEDGVRHLVAEDDEPASVGAKQALHAALDVLDDALVAFVQVNQNGVNALKIRHFCCRFFSEKLLQGTIQGPISKVG